MARTHTDRILFGAAYYDEYMPKDLDRVDEDMRMMKEAGINLIRIAESTWSTEEPQPGVFDFTHIDRALDAAQRAGIDVIVGTPTYAVPTWMVRMHPEVLAVTPAGPGKYGARQIMDIVNPTYRFYAERIIRRLIAHVADHPAVIGYQVDNETKYYDSVSPDMQALFVKYLRERFNDDLDELNARFGLDYWSNRVNAWEDFPDVTGTINQSLLGEFDRFRRAQVAEFLKWQADIVREYAKPDQFITHNFDFEWRGADALRLENLPQPGLAGENQYQNLAGALAVLCALRARCPERFPIDRAALARGIASARIRARFERISSDPEIILDVGHNPQAAAVLAENLRASKRPGTHTLAVFGMLKDKDRAGVVSLVRSEIDEWFVAGLPGPRGADLENIKAALLSGGVDPALVHGCPSIAKALADARAHAANACRSRASGSSADRIIVFGSFVTVTEALEAFEAAHREAPKA